jgi:predicted nucleic acid-binding protein
LLLVDTNVLLDVLQDDPHWCSWSLAQLDRLSQTDTLCINAVVYAELSIAFRDIVELDQAVETMGLELLEIPREALFLAGKVFAAYRRRGGTKSGVLPDFLIGAHAAIEGMSLLTRDAARFRSNFPTLQVITPAKAEA